MNTVIQQLFERKSTRVYEPKEISKEDKQLILEAATQAPSAGNMQLYTILDITDQKIKDTLAQTCDHQPFIAQAKMILIFCADYQKWYDAFNYTNCQPRKPQIGDLLLAISDATIAAQNAVVAATSLGIGSCYIGDIVENCEIHQELLHLPDYVFPCAMLVFGYPTKNQQERVKPKRVALKHIVHENGYRHMKEDELEEMWTPQANIKTYQEWMQAFCKRKYNTDFSREMSRSCEKYLSKFR